MDHCGSVWVIVDQCGLVWIRVGFSCSGQSGSGKTEASKLILGYLSFFYEGRNQCLRQVFSRHPSQGSFNAGGVFQEPTPAIILLAPSSPWKCFPSWKVLEMPRPSSTTTPAASANTFTSTSSSRSAGSPPASPPTGHSLRLFYVDCLPSWLEGGSLLEPHCPNTSLRSPGWFSR